MTGGCQGVGGGSNGNGRSGESGATSGRDCDGINGRGGVRVGNGDAGVGVGGRNSGSSVSNDNEGAEGAEGAEGDVSFSDGGDGRMSVMSGSMNRFIPDSTSVEGHSSNTNSTPAVDKSTVDKTNSTVLTALHSGLSTRDGPLISAIPVSRLCVSGTVLMIERASSSSSGFTAVHGCRTLLILLAQLLSVREVAPKTRAGVRGGYSQAHRALCGYSGL
jgi:hypothetical protein